MIKLRDGAMTDHQIVAKLEQALDVYPPKINSTICHEFTQCTKAQGKFVQNIGGHAICLDGVTAAISKNELHSLGPIQIAKLRCGYQAEHQTNNTPKWLVKYI